MAGPDAATTNFAGQRLLAQRSALAGQLAFLHDGVVVLSLQYTPNLAVETAGGVSYRGNLAGAMIEVRHFPPSWRRPEQCEFYMDGKPSATMTQRWPYLRGAIKFADGTQFTRRGSDVVRANGSNVVTGDRKWLSLSWNGEAWLTTANDSEPAEYLPSLFFAATAYFFPSPTV